MPLSISENLFSTSNCSEEILSSSQLLISSSIQSFCAEAVSFSAIFGLGVGQTVSCLVKAQSFRFLPTLFGSKTSRIPLYNVLSSGFGILAEGAVFPIATNFGKTGEFHFATWQETVHGSFTIGACKVVGTYLKIGNIILQHFVQDCAMVSVDYSFERIGWIEAKQEGLVLRLAGAELTSFRMAISAKLLATSCPDLAYIRVRQEIDIEVYKSNRPERSNHFWDPLKTLFSPALGTNNGETLKQNSFSEREPIVQAKDLIHKIQGKGNEGESSNPLDFIPCSAQAQLIEVEKVNSKLATLLRNTWCTLYQTPSLIKDIGDRGGLLIAYTKAIEICLQGYAPEQRSFFTEFGITVFFSGVPEGENYYFPSPSLNLGKGTTHKRGVDRKRSSENEKQPKPTVETFLAFERENPELAKWVKISLAIWRAEQQKLAREKKQYTKALEHGEGISEKDRTHQLFELMTRKFLRGPKPLIDLRYYYEKILPGGIRFLEIYEEILQDSNPLEELHAEEIAKVVEPIKESPPEDIFENNETRNIDPENPTLPKKSYYSIWESRYRADPRSHLALLMQVLMKRMGEKPLDSDSPLSMLTTAMSQGLIGMAELDRLAKTDSYPLFSQLCGEIEFDQVKDPRIILSIQRVFEERGVAFDGPSFFVKLHPHIPRLFPETTESPPIIRITKEEFNDAYRFNLGLEMTRWRLDNRRDGEFLGHKEMGGRIGQSEGAVNRYEMNVMRPEQESTLAKILDELPSTQTPQSRRAAYLAVRYEVLSILPVDIIDGEGNVLRRISSDEIERFQRERKEKLGSAIFHEELLAPLPPDQRTVSGLADYFKEKKYPKLAIQAKKYFAGSVVMISIEELRDLCRCMNLSFRKWVLHFHPSYAYFLGTDELGNVILPTPNEFAELHKIPACSEELFRKIHKGKIWDFLTLEEKWILYLYELPYDKFETANEVVEGMGAETFRYVSYLAKNIRARLWPNESIAKYSNNLGLDPAKRRQIFVYFREEILREMLLEESKTDGDLISSVD